MTGRQRMIAFSLICLGWCTVTVGFGAAYWLIDTADPHTGLAVVIAGSFAAAVFGALMGLGAAIDDVRHPRR